MLFRFLFILFFIDSLHAKNLYIQDIPKDNISVNINGEYIVRENVINVDKFSGPLNVSVYFVSNDRKNIFLSLQKSFLEIEESNVINNKETIINIIEKEIKNNIDITDNSLRNLRNIVLDLFSEEIKKFSSFESFNLIKKLDLIKTSSFNLKLKDAIEQLNNKYYSNSIVNLENIKNLKQHYIITKEILFYKGDVSLNTISIYPELKKRIELRTVYNKNTLFLVFNKRNDTLSFINYLEPSRDKVSEEFETMDLISFVFDELLIKCTDLFDNQRECYYFDKVEKYVNDKDNLIHEVYNSLPYDIEERDSLQKLSIIRKSFIDTIAKIVNKSKSINLESSLFY